MSTPSAHVGKRLAEVFDDLDLAILDGADVVLRFETVRPNRLVYAREGFDHGAYDSRAVPEYFDLLPILAIRVKR
ncbi:MAG: hypothetical protein ACREA0_09215 [bacterium]